MTDDPLKHKLRPPFSTELWGGPYPLSVGNVPPTQVKVWFNTVANQLMVWNWHTLAWQPVSSTVNVGPTPPTAIGQLYIDPNQKLWVFVDDLCELTEPIPGGPAAADGAKFTASPDPPLNPAKGDLWFVPQSQNLSIWNGFVWVRIGRRVRRTVRTGNYAGTWNAGGNRSQATAAGGILYLSGMRGIDPLTQRQLPGPGPGNTPGKKPPNTAPNADARIIQIYQNIKTIVEAEGLSLFDCTGLVTSLTSAAYIGPTATLTALPQFWGNGPYPPRTHQVWLQMSGSDTESEFPGFPPRGDIVEVQATFWMGGAERRNPTALSEAAIAIPGVSVNRT
jgi:enamine deaminase RidA (YjgF/YER057c/UK114 family)